MHLVLHVLEEKWQLIFIGYNKSYNKLTVKPHRLYHCSDEARKREKTPPTLSFFYESWGSVVKWHKLISSNPEKRERSERAKLVFNGVRIWTHGWHCALLPLTKIAISRNQEGSTHSSLFIFQNSSWSHYWCSANIKLGPYWITISVGQKWSCRISFVSI